jgi:hypothetical protein
VKYFFPEPVNAQESELLERVAATREFADLTALTPDALRRISEQHGCDFATALLHRRIVDSGRHGPFLRGLSAHSNRVDPHHARVAIVPGAFHRENPHTGADGRVVRQAAEQAGMLVRHVPVSSTGFLAENAQCILQWLRAHRELPLILVSVSKGGSDVKMALAHPESADAFQHVIGWINVCGILDGTPMADWLVSPHWLARANRFVYRIRGRSLDFLSDLQRYPGCPLDFPLALPSHLRVVHVLGFPLRHHLRNGLARRCHARLESFGPNDGSIVLADSLRWPGQLCPVWGADHYLRPATDERPLLAAILRSLAAPHPLPFTP